VTYLYIKQVADAIDAKRTHPPGHVFTLESTTPSGPPPPWWTRIVLAFFRLFGYKN
jgi:hypothetical protein